MSLIQASCILLEVPTVPIVQICTQDLTWTVIFQESHLVLKYCDLMLSFVKMLKARATKEVTDSSDAAVDSFADTIGINAFRGFLDEFLNKKKIGELPAVKKEKKDKKKKKDKDKEVVVSAVYLSRLFWDYLHNQSHSFLSMIEFLVNL